jgi:predicted DNA-binding transcriptional regulator AlpA
MRKMTRFSVHVQARDPEGTPKVLINEDAAEQLMDLLAKHDVIVAGGSGRWDVTVGVDAPDLIGAASMAAELVDSMAVKSGMPDWPIVRIDAVRVEVLEEEIARPTLPELVSVPEVAEILGVSPQRVHELAADGRGFPKPVYELKAGKMWLQAAIEAFGSAGTGSPQSFS